nr:alpha/beta fold hydrolase [Micromonospora sp. 15K316]
MFLQGVPGNRKPRPEGRGGWLGRALDGYCVLLLGQRATGRSTPANRQTLPRRGDAAAQADYLAQFRADSIVRDAELIRRELLGEDEKWSVLGQSYGGFCTLTYLSYPPEGLREAFVTGGLAGLRSTATDVYRAAYPRVQRKVEAHYARYPDDVETVRAVVRHLREREVRLPGGGLLTAEAFQALGNCWAPAAGRTRCTTCSRTPSWPATSCPTRSSPRSRATSRTRAPRSTRSCTSRTTVSVRCTTMCVGPNAVVVRSVRPESRATTLSCRCQVPN